MVRAAAASSPACCRPRTRPGSSPPARPRGAGARRRLALGLGRRRHQRRRGRSRGRRAAARAPGRPRHPALRRRGRAAGRGGRQPLRGHRRRAGRGAALASVLAAGRDLLRLRSDHGGGDRHPPDPRGSRPRDRRGAGGRAARGDRRLRHPRGDGLRLAHRPLGRAQLLFAFYALRGLSLFFLPRPRHEAAAGGVRRGLRLDGSPPCRRPSPSPWRPSAASAPA